MSNEFVMVRREVVESILQGAYTRFLTASEVDALKSASAEPSTPCDDCKGWGFKETADSGNCCATCDGSGKEPSAPFEVDGCAFDNRPIRSGYTLGSGAESVGVLQQRNLLVEYHAEIQDLHCKLGAEVSKRRAMEAMAEARGVHRDTIRMQLGEMATLLCEVRDSFGPSWRNIKYADRVDAAIYASVAHPGDPIDSATFVKCTPGQGLDPGAKRYDIQGGDNQGVYPVEDPNGEWVRHKDIVDRNPAVDRDERKAFEQWEQSQPVNYDAHSHAFDAWQARANLEKKPC